MYSFLIPKNVITAFLSSLGEVVIFGMKKKENSSSKRFDDVIHMYLQDVYHEKVSTSIQNECCLLLPIFRIWPFSADAYCPKLLAIFFSDRKFLLDSKYLEFAIYRSHDLDSG